MRSVSLLKTGTGARWAVRQLQTMSANGTESLVLIPPGPTADELASIPGVEVRRTGAVSDPGNLRVLRDWQEPIRRAVAEYRPDVVHSHFVATTVAARWAMRRASVPVVFQVPGPLHLESAWSRRLDVGTARPIDRWIATCEWSRTLLRRAGVATDRVGLAYYGLDATAWDLRPSRDSVRALGVPDDRTVVGMVSFVYPARGMNRRGIKGHEDFFAAVQRVIAAGANIQAVMVGGARPGAEGYHEELSRKGRMMLGDRLSLVGSVADVRPWYAAMDVAVHPSHSENLGAAAESMMAGIPTIATRVGGFPDLVLPGVTGWLVPARRPQLLADMILRVLSDPAHARELALAGQAHARRLLDPFANASLVHGYLLQAATTHAREASSV